MQTNGKHNRISLLTSGASIFNKREFSLTDDQLDFLLLYTHYMLTLQCGWDVATRNMPTDSAAQNN